MENIYDVIIIGGGPGGLGCALYAARYMLNSLLIYESPGGAIGKSNDVENYPGTIRATGLELMDQWTKHAEKFGAKTLQSRVTSVSLEHNAIYNNDIFVVKTQKETFKALTIVLATGSKERHLGVPGEKEFFGKGVSTCPTCDGFFFSNKIVAVVGGGDAALRGVQVMLQYSSKVYLIHRRNEFRAEPILISQVKQDPKCEFILGRQIKEIRGDKLVKEVLLDDGNVLKLDGIFVEIGSDPNTSLVTELGVKLAEGNIVTDASQSTNIPGLFAAGDITTGSNKFRQVITAASEGAIAADSAFKYVSALKASK